MALRRTLISHLLVLSGAFASIADAVSCRLVGRHFSENQYEFIVDANSPLGLTLLKNSQIAGFAAPYARLVRFYEPQKTSSLCSVATGVLAIRVLRNDLRGIQSQEFLNAATDAIRPSQPLKTEDGEIRDLPDGQTIDQFQQMITRVHGFQATLKRALDNEESLSDFRNILMSTLTSSESVLIVNYYEASLAPEWGSNGHFSPVAAFDPATDRALIADVFQDSSQRVTTDSWFWVDLKALHKAMVRIDPDSGKSRGYLAVSSARRAPL